jgi:hypothetical protein
MANGPHQTHCNPGGAFGDWSVDSAGLPVYEYTCDQDNDTRADAFTTRGPSRLHWHQFGNDTFNAICTNRGEVQVIESSRGLQWLTFHDPQRLCPGAGIALVQQGARAWADLYAPGAPARGFRRLFGTHYFRKINELNGLRTDHRIMAPFGAAPVLFCELIVTNTSPVPINVTVFEYLGVRLHYMAADMVVMPPDRAHFGVSPMEQIPALALRAARAAAGMDTDSIRRSHGDRFRFSAAYHAQNHCLVQTPEYTRASRPPRSARASRNFYPDSLFLARLNHPAPGAETHVSDTRSLLKNHPDLFAACGVTTNNPAMQGPAPCLALGEQLVIDPGQTHRLVFAAGYAPKNRIPEIIQSAHTHISQNKGQNLLLKQVERWKSKLAFFKTETKAAKSKPDWLAREATWHAAYTRGAVLSDEYYECRYLPQGGAYEYIHGLRGAVRDLAIFTIPLVYMDPAMARDLLRFCLRLQTPSGRLMYTNYNFGQAGGALVHNNPTDLHLFLLWALCEYLFFTRDFDFLDERVPFYPKENKQRSTVRERVALSLDYLFHEIGTGAHGLLRVGDGDWSDGISLFVRNRGAFVKHGESAFNTAMALYVLPRVADLLQATDPARAADLHKRRAALLDATLASWTGQWFPRGFDGRGHAFGVKKLFLEHHAWLLVADCLPEDKKHRVIHHIKTILDDPSPFGQKILHPPANTAFGFHEKGWDVNGGIWYAINYLLCWGYSKSDPDLAWAAFHKNSCARRAEVYPDIWYGLWSGPDAYNAHACPRAGETYYHMPTPTTDFPVMNLNLHAGFLLALIKLCGVEPCMNGLTINPRIPSKNWRLSLPAVTISQTGGRAQASFNPALPHPEHVEVFS